VKLERALVRNFKGVREIEIDFSSSSGAAPRQLTALLGDNGSGKTTVLQAIALTLSMATGRTRMPDEFNWMGFNAERLSTLGDTHVELDVRFDANEIALVEALFPDWYAAHPLDWRESPRSLFRVVTPARNERVKLLYDGGRLSSPQGDESINQFRGRYYVEYLSRTQPARRELLPKLGDVFWFQQERNLSSAVADRGGEANERPWEYEGWLAGVEHLRKSLVELWAYHTSSNQSYGRDYIVLLEEQFARVFPGTRFSGVAPRGGTCASTLGGSYVFLERDGKVYDIAEMSSGEQAVFSLAYEFVRLDIAKSVVLIDELELHLHPPQQQALLGALRKLGEDCQFIITTHSPFLEDVIPREEEVRLLGGRGCL